MTGFGQAVDAALEAGVVPGFSRIGLAVRSRLLPEFTAGDPPAIGGKTVIITGATSGIGYAAAVALARRGAAVHFLARGRDRAERARRGIAAESGSTCISYGLADMEDLDAVRDFARQFNATHDRLDVLIHNAGAIHPQFRTDAAGTELTVLGQVIAPFLLTRLLMPALLAAAPSRVITVSSGGMYTQRLDPATLQMPRIALPGRHRVRESQAGAGGAEPGVGTADGRNRCRVPRHAPGLGEHPRCGRHAAGLLPGHPADPPHTSARSRHHVWLATMPPERLGSGRFWHDRRPRPEYPLPWTRGQDPHAGRELWDHLDTATATGAPKLAQAGPDSAAADRDISSRGRGGRAAAV